MIDFERAQAIVRASYAPGWTEGTFWVAPFGWEDAEAWRVVIGAREALLDGDPDFILFDFPAILVRKDSGQIFEISVLTYADALDRMRPVGDVPE